MTRDDIIRWAKEAGWKRVGRNSDAGPEFPVLIGNLERFHAIAVAAEREACAKACDALSDRYADEGGDARSCAAAIRARGEV